MAVIEVNIDYIKTVNYALHHNGIAVCKSLEVKNTSGDELRNVQVHCEGKFIKPYSSAVVPVIKPGVAMRLPDFTIAPDAEELVSLTERVITDFTVKVTAGDETVHEQQYDIELMAYDQWMGLTEHPQTIASFITPNHPAVSAILLKASEILLQVNGSTTFTAYQTGNCNDVHIQAAAIYEAVQQSGIVYRELAASFEEKGQRVWMPETVMSSHLANCLEMSVLFCSALEAVGINSGIVFVNGHAFNAVWLVPDNYPFSMCDDAAWLEKQCSQGIDEMIVFESTCANGTDSFDRAIEIATQRISYHNTFQALLDVKSCRLEHFRPMPSRIESNGKWVVDTTTAPLVEHNIQEARHDRYDLTQLRESNRELTKFDIWERKLLDFSLRNTLLNLYLRKRAVQFISFDIGRIEDHLQDGEEYCLMQKPETCPTIETKVLTRSKQLEELRPLISNDIESHRLHTYLSDKETQDVFKNIYRAARNAIEETGANSLFLSIGAMRWYETPQSETPRFAPLMLLPVEMVYKKGRYYIRTREEDIVLNITLMEFLRQNYDINITGLNPLPKDEHGVDVNLIIAAVRDAIKEQKRWDVEEECLLGIFSFSKFLMWNDVHNNRDKLLENKIVESLVANRLTFTPEPTVSNLKDIDSSTDPTQVALPVPVDSSQMAAIIEGGKGHSFVLYGPPGTGKSQTITNLIANALYQGKRVLFVAEKMAALSVVQSRLAKIGLDPFCLELHSNKASKRHVLQQLDKALHVAHIKSPEDYKETADRIFAERKNLIEYMQALHTVDNNDGLSLYDCIVRYETIDAQPLAEYTGNATLDATLAGGGVKALEDILGKLDTVLRLVGQPSQHPLNGLNVDTSMLMDTNGVTSQMTAAAQYIVQCNSQRDTLGMAKTLYEAILRDNNPAILGEDAREIYDSWRAAKAKWFIPRFFAKRAFVKRMRQYNPYATDASIDALTDNLLTYSEKHNQIEQLRGIMQHYFGLAIPADAVPDASLLQSKVQDLNRWAQHTSQMRDWHHWCNYRNELIAAGMGCVVTAIENRPFSASEMRDSFFKALFMKKAQDKSSRTQLLATFEGMIFDERVKSYKQLTEEYQVLTQKELYARLAARVPRVTDSIDNSSEIGLLNRNVSNGGRGVSMRDLFDQIGTLLPRLCPCMLMSPMSVAQYLDLAAEKFDLVVFDEASQMPTSEAVGAIARGKSLIVVGDPKQMPPTSFFTSTNVDEDEAYIDDMESILEDCRTLEIPSLQLNWHYRSRHESLIAFSNNEYYDGQLITFPSVDDQHTKVGYIPVSGYYDKGGRRSNKAEADAIVDEIVRRLKDAELHKMSIGVIAFSVVQQSLIEDILQERLDKDHSLREAADAMYEPIFVKNLENVQGDERDVILFSIGYGPDKDGKVSMNFGPLNNEGGERRLNVAVSRARHEMLVYSTLKSSQVDLRRSKARGVEGLKHFLEYAETQSLATVPGNQSQHSDSTLARIIADRLRSHGYVVTTGVGRSQFKVDIAVSQPEHPDVYRLGILLDGEAYRDTQTTRDREIVQPSVLNGLKWNVMRVWSIDWFNNPQRVIDRIIEQINTEPEPEPEPQTQNTAFEISNSDIEERPSHASSYNACTMSESQAIAMTDRGLMTHIINTEQPIQFTLLCKRMASLRGMTRVTPKMKNDLLPRVKHMFFTQPDRNDLTVWMTEQVAMEYTGYRCDDVRDITEIPLCEVKNVILESVEEQVALPCDNLTLIATKKLGFTRRGNNLDTALNEAVMQLKEEGRIEEVDGKLRIQN